MATVVIVGSGGREHAFASVLNDSPKVSKIYCVPGNAGTQRLSKGENVALANSGVAAFAEKRRAKLVIIGPEAPLMMGLADEIRARNIPVLGPNEEAARLETSKAFATEFMMQHDIPIPPSSITQDVDTAMAVVEKLGPQNSVLKVDGLANGKGVVLPESLEEARDTLERMFSGAFDGSGHVVVIQKRYHGPEVSAFVLSDGQGFTFIPLLAQDHKRLLAGDKGPNTGGMGAYAPLPSHMITRQQIEKLHAIAKQTVDGMKEAGQPYQGILFIGAMLADETGGDPVVIEYNARFGDPEAEVILPLLTQNGVDWYDVFHSVASGDAARHPLPSTVAGSAVAICLAAKGYPQRPRRGDVVYGLGKKYANVQLFHGGTKDQDGKVLTSGGRVIYVTGFGPTLEQALHAANAAIGPKGVHFADMQYRDDIGYRATKSH